MYLLPAKLLPAGLFIAACFVSISVGTSVGTVVALVPVAAGLAEQTALDPAWLTAIVVGGAFFGDNLSFISDTTIAATRTQECELRDKFRVNVRIVAPAALITLCIYLFTATDIAAPTPERIEGIKIIPYLLVLVTAIAGLNVMKVLILGIVAAGVIGIATNSFGALEWCSCMGQGINGMGELIIITMLAGGLLELIRVNGGIDYLINLLTRHISGRRGAEGSIAALVCMANLCTANNTIAILSVGTIARDIADRYGIDRRRSASLLDTFSCLTQGVLPYGAQLLMAAGLTGLSPLNIIGYLYYPMIMGACAVLAIIFRYPRKF
jgi:Na+/H+ antiporter NhaC